MCCCLAAGQYAADAAAGVSYVAGIARDEVNVNVHARLAARGSDVDADIVAIGPVLFSDDGLGTIEERKNGRLFLRRHVEKICDVTARDDQDMAGCKTVTVVARISELVLQKNHRRLAKFAGRLVGHLLDRLRVDRRPRSAGDDQRGTAEEEFVDAILLAVLGEFLKIENLAHAKTHGRDHDPVPGLVGFSVLVRTYLDAPGVDADRCDLLFLAPVAVLELHTRSVAAGIATPVLLFMTTLHLSRAHDDKVATADGHILLLGALIELVIRNALTILHPFHTAEARDIEEHAAANHFVLGVLDAEDRKATRVDQLGVVAVVGLVLIEDVAEGFPVLGPLHAQGQRVVGLADLVPVRLARDRISASGEHLMDRIEAPAEQASLRTGAVEGYAKRENLAGTDQA